MQLGAGRKTKDDEIDHAVGIVLCRKTGDEVKAGDTLAMLHVREDGEAARRVAEHVRDAFVLEAGRPASKPLILSVVTKDGVTRFA
jgi:Thymidine phosphorylase